MTGLNPTFRSMIHPFAAWMALVVPALASAQEVSPQEDLHTLQGQVIQVVDQALPSVVRLTSGGRSGTMATGVVFDRSGLVLTAGHVVREGPRRITIVFPDGTRRRGRVLSGFFEDDVDLGVISIVEQEEDREGWPFSPLAPEGSLERGEWIVTLGHAAAISTGDNREPATRIGRVIGIEGAELAMDSPIDAGDSGGPILDLEGRIVGIASRCGHLPWQNLATSIDAIHAWMPHLMDPEVDPPSVDDWEGQTRRGSPVGSRRDPDLLASLESTTRGASNLLVEIRDGDRLVSHGTMVAPDRVITKASQFARHVRTPRVIRPGTDDGPQIEFQARAIGLDADLDLLLLEVPGLSEQIVAPLPETRHDPLRSGSMLVIPRSDGSASDIAVVARNLDEIASRDTRDDLPFLGVATTPSEDGGLRVIRIVASTAAARTDLKVGDVIRTADGRTVQRTADLVETIADLGIGDGLIIEFDRDGDTLQIEVDLGLRPDSSRSGMASNTSIGTSRLSTGMGSIHLVDADAALDTIGGPVVDADGRIAGWLAARRSRTSMVVVPWTRVIESIDRLEDPASPDRRNVNNRLCSYRVVATPDQEDVIRLDAEDAFPDGDILRREKLGPGGRTTWGSWMDVDDALEWAINVDRPGRWQVRVTSACPRRHAGTPIRLKIGEASAEGRIERTRSWEDFQDFDLGIIEVGESGDLTVRLEPAANPRHAVANILGIELRRLPDEESGD